MALTPLIRRLILKAAQRYNIKPSHLAGQEFVESGFNPGAVSSANAFGISQFIPSTAAAYGVKRGTSKKAVKSQIMGQAHYLQDLGYERGNRGAIMNALGRYYGDPSSDYASRVLSAAKDYRSLNSGAVPESLGGSKLDRGRSSRSTPPASAATDPTTQMNQTLADLTPQTIAGQRNPELQEGYELLAQLSGARADASGAAERSLGRTKFGRLLDDGGDVAPGSSGIAGWAASKIGTQEGSAAQQRWAKQLGMSAGLPWCSIFVAQALRHSGIRDLPSNPAYSGAWLSWGGGQKVGLGKIRPGDIVVFDWGDGGMTDHVAIYAGNGKVVGGNQSNAVTKVPLDRGAVIGVIRPKGGRRRR